MRPVRIQLSRKAGFRLQEASLAVNGLGAVKVDRSTRWGNFAAKVGEDISHYTLDCTSATAADVVDLYRRFLDAERIVAPDEFEELIAPLRGKNLACWCKDGPCHADVLLELANAGDVE